MHSRCSQHSSKDPYLSSNFLLICWLFLIHFQWSELTLMYTDCWSQSYAMNCTYFICKDYYRAKGLRKSSVANAMNHECSIFLCYQSLYCSWKYSWCCAYITYVFPTWELVFCLWTNIVHCILCSSAWFDILDCTSQVFFLAVQLSVWSYTNSQMPVCQFLH